MSRTGDGISFWDVREQADALGHLFHCIVHFELHLPMRRNTAVAWQVRCVARWYDVQGRVMRERGEGADWPNIDSKTFAGLEFLLIRRLERKLTDELIDEERAAADQQRLF